MSPSTRSCEEQNVTSSDPVIWGSLEGVSVELEIEKALSPTKYPTWYDEVDKKLTEIQFLEENWDSYNAETIDENLIYKARRLLSSVNKKNLPKPFIAPVKNGGINIEWNIASRFLSIKLRKEGTRFFFVDREKKVEGERSEGGDMPYDDEEKLEELLEWVV